MANQNYRSRASMTTSHPYAETVDVRRRTRRGSPFQVLIKKNIMRIDFAAFTGATVITESHVKQMYNIKATCVFSASGPLQEAA